MNNTKPLWILAAACLVGLWLYTDFDLLPTPYNLVLEPESEVRAPGSGTAFSVGDGVWMTARHVVRDCDGVGFIKNRKLVGIVDRVVDHEVADLSLLYSDFSAEPLPIATPDQDPQRHEEAFLIGFPGGVPRQFVAAQVEYREIAQHGNRNGDFPVIVWAERPEPPVGTDYAGMSGGPAINADGFVVGVLVGSDNALGRIVANVPETLRTMMQEGPGTTPAAALHAPLTHSLAETGNTLRMTNRVVEIYCHVE